jgi:hypothetical protein
MQWICHGSSGLVFEVQLKIHLVYSRRDFEMRHKFDASCSY